MGNYNHYYILEDDEKTAIEATREVFFKWVINGKKRVAKTEISEIEISTVFLGINHAISPEDPPQIFETMIFGGEHDEYQERYSTYEEAVEGHERACELVRKSNV